MESKMRGEEKQELILIPSPAIGHLVCAIELVTRLLSHSTRFSHVTVLLTKHPESATQVDAYKSSLASQVSRLTWVDLPPAPIPPLDLYSKCPENFYTLYIEAHAPQVRRAMENILGSTKRVAGVLLDFFFSSFADVAEELGLPSYVYLTSGASMLGLMLYLPTRHVSTEFALSDPELAMPGFSNSVPPRVLPSAVFNTEGGYTTYMKMAKRFRETKGIIVNTILELESYALSSLSKDMSVPPIYPVGPLINLKGDGKNTMGLGSGSGPGSVSDSDSGSSVVSSQGIKILKWLDEQPSNSVVLLCFGSIGVFSVPQLKEIAIGLEASGHRFLWSINKLEGCMEGSEALPEGFVERMRERGMVCGWVPQVEVLAHRAIGGFVSHCGWNSILESLWNGVPIVTWPMYAEQQINAFMMVKELGMAVELRLDYRMDGDEVVAAKEVEKAVREVMKEDSAVRVRVAEAKKKSRAAVGEGGSSFNVIGQLVEDMLGANV